MLSNDHAGAKRNYSQRNNNNLRHAVNENSCKKKINDWSTLPFGKQFGAEPL